MLHQSQKTFILKYMNEGLLHARTMQQLELFLKQPSQFVLVTGPDGAGKNLFLHYLAKKILKKSEGTYKHKIIELGLEKPPSIEETRQLKRELHRKAAGDNEVNRVIIINKLSEMGQEAQNALLKVLEDIPESTISMAGARQPSNVLPTIRSRVTQQIDLLPVSLDEALKYFSNNNHSHETITSAWQMSGGRAELLRAILENDQHPMQDSVEIAKKLLKASTFEKLTLINDINKKDRTDIEQLITTLRMMAHSAIRNLSNKNTSNDAYMAWLNVSRQSLIAQQQLLSNAQTKMVLTNLCINI